jgi:Fe-S oxidoreductase
MAKLKAQVKHKYHEEEGTSLRTRVFADIDTVARVGSMLAPVSNWAQRLPGSDAVAEKLGIAPDRSLPHFTRHTLEDWFDERTPRVSAEDAEAKVVLFPDTFTNYSYPEPGKATVEVLEAAGIHVDMPDDAVPTGRAAFSMGKLDKAHARAKRNIQVLLPYIENGYSVVFVEPSDAVMLQDEYLDIIGGPAAERVAANTYGICEYMDVHRVAEELDFDAPPEYLTYHGHCNQKALNKDHHAAAILSEAGYEVDALDSGCCGMAGSFGYEAEHYSMSQAIGTVLFEQIEETDPDYVVAPGASCRTQIEDEFGRELPHPIEKVAEALEESEALA